MRSMSHKTAHILPNVAAMMDDGAEQALGFGVEDKANPVTPLFPLPHICYSCKSYMNSDIAC